MVEEEEAVGGVFMFRIGLDPFVLVCAHSRDTCLAWWHLKQSLCFRCLSCFLRDILYVVRTSSIAFGSW